MKKLIVGAVMALGIFSATAQNKIGYISTDELISLMPEALKVDAELKEYQLSLQQMGQALQVEEKADIPLIQHPLLMLRALN